MRQVRIVTDSTSDIPEELQKSLGIHVVPLKVHFGADTYQDGVDMGSEAFFEKLIDSSVLPTTSQPSPVEFLEIYKSLAKESDAPILSLHLSSALSGTYQSAILAQTMLEVPADVMVIDSKLCSYGFGMLVVAAAEAAMEGKSKDEITQLVDKMRKETKLYFLVDTLEYLQKGGRIGKAAALLGSLLNIKPILSMNADGEVHSVDKLRGHKKALARIVELLKRDFGDQPLQIGIADAHSKAGAEEFSLMMKQHFVVNHLQSTQIGPVVGTHTGPGTVAVFVCPV
ncbi:EDD domain protein, DegV family [Paenibacillus sp. 1_12]|uniref:DegV family protein n=1 Tax=Paenibacillus sp. 1_12 TaxID=1566278 RepID=UPI0008DFBBAA|nr:DegV family protein [Paenibacillus sp. 1_12]SFL47513.1 EDD domain protein, DegV family [Paenibacillus sp. 1_12]